MAVNKFLRLLVLGCLFIFMRSDFLMGQYALSLGFQLESTNSNSATNDPQLLPNNFNIATIGANYWFRLKNYRTEFFPGIQYSYSLLNINIKESGIQIETPVHFFIFDFKNDCNCPTFGKDGSIFTKGFFLKFNSIHKWNNRSIDAHPDIKNPKYLAYLGAGLGIEIPLSKLWSIIPSLTYLTSTNDAYKTSITSDINRHGIQLSCSLLYRHDYRKNYYRR